VLQLVISLVTAQTNPVGAGLEASLSLIGKPYAWGGRLRKGEGIDCMGVVLAAAERASGCGWKSYSVKPTELVAQRTWGTPVPHLSPIATEALDVKSLEKGDVLLFVGPLANPAEPAIATMDTVPVWVWHVGLYVGEGNFVVGDHHAGHATIEPLLPYLAAHADEYSGEYVLRGPAAKPAKCRRHPPLAPAPKR
jgi:cell wall-associated NlpC family hydrolase